MLWLRRGQAPDSSQVQSSDNSPSRRTSSRLSVRWGLILLASTVIALIVGPSAGLPAAVGVWIAMTVCLDQIIDAG